MDGIGGSSSNAASGSQHHTSQPNTPPMTAPVMDAGVENVVPKPGMVFLTIEEAMTFYSEYGSRIGFETMRRSSKGKGEKTKYVVLACSRNGCPQTKGDNGKATKSKKVKCPAKMWLKLRDDGLWEITKDGVKLDHVHELSLS